MPLQNRVDPYGEIVAHPARGTVMGNRGRLHRPDRTLGRRRWAVRAWICCRLDFRGRHRTVMAPDSYTELFFLDEATALSAGHRPCYECRRADYRAFLDAWARGNGVERDGLRAGEVDRQLHAERLTPDRGKRVSDARLGELPDGCMVCFPAVREQPWLVCGQVLRRWTPTGYDSAIPRDNAASVLVLTPRSTVAALAAGFRPALHPSAGG